ncbi:sel1 repeat family protein [Mesorhizobium sp. M1A.F.Ca.ET.072.01.1.1]|uniref:tetratricopeptide repeat protein n=1 Tax=Mesorhizobium sp. M1A.F.Ca.ET.072.01.1.1 TaxID=2496753 RepID=UPI0016744235|nr:sel1 repeat family protein [Mesorhizobium sp. M1A.F.Ca.ET.072.01.1.1]
MSNNDGSLDANTTVISAPVRRHGRILFIILALLAAYVLLGPLRNYYVQWSAIRKVQAAHLAKDYEEEFRQLSVLASMGNRDAQGYLGAMYWRGDGTAQNDEQAVYWWRKSADGGIAEAEASLSQSLFSWTWCREGRSACGQFGEEGGGQGQC